MQRSCSPLAPRSSIQPPGVGACVTMPFTGRPERRLLRLGLRRERRHLAAGRVDDERRAARPDGRRAPVQPEVVVEAGGAVLPAVDAVGRRGPRGGPVQQLLVAGEGLLLEARRLFRGQELLFRQIVGPLHRGDRAEVPDALDVRRAPCRAGCLRLTRRERRRQGHDRGRGAQNGEVFGSSSVPPSAFSGLARRGRHPPRSPSRPSFEHSRPSDAAPTAVRSPPRPPALRRGRRAGCSGGRSSPRGRRTRRPARPTASLVPQP